MKKIKIKFCEKYQCWVPPDWKKMMLSDESTFRLAREALEFVAVEHLDIVMDRNSLIGNKNRHGQHSLLKNVMASGSDYINVLRNLCQYSGEFMKMIISCMKATLVTS